MKSWDKNFWKYFFVGWLFIWPTALTMLILIYGIGMVGAVGLLLLPFIVCGFFIPLFLVYEKTNFPIGILKKCLFTVNPERPKTIHYFCILLIPGTIVFIFALILSPNQFLEYGPIYNEKYSYGLAFFQFLTIFAYLGYWNLKRWGFFLYIIAVILRVWILNYMIDAPVYIKDFIWDFYVILIGFYFIIRKRRLQS